MKITSSYRMKLTGDLKALENSIRMYRDAIHFVIPIVDAHWDEMKDFEYSNQRMTYTEKLIHSTDENQLDTTLMKNFLSSHRIYAELYLMMRLVSSPRITAT